nr:hypothetical protein [Tanacetum cinerariifolium]
MSVRLADRSFQYPVKIAKNMLVKVVIRVKQKQLNLEVGTERLIFNIDSAMKHTSSNDDTCFSINVIDEILEGYFDALLDEGSIILHSIEGTLLEEEIFSEFDEFMAMAVAENSESEYDTEEPPSKKITINTDYKIKTSLEEPPMDLELKSLPDNLEYVFLEEPSFLTVTISSQLSAQNKSKLVSFLKNIKKPLLGKQQTFLKQLNLEVGTERLIFNIDSAMKHTSSNVDTCFSIDVIDEILEGYFDALLDEGSIILHSIEGTLHEEEIFSEFDEFMAMAVAENSESESDTEEPPSKKITINTDYKIKTSLEEPPMDLELKSLPDNLEYVFLEEPSFLTVTISSQLSAQNKSKLVSFLKNIKKPFLGKRQTFLVSVHHSANTRYNFWMTRNQLSKKRRLNPNMQEVVTK